MRISLDVHILIDGKKKITSLRVHNSVSNMSLKHFALSMTVE